MLDIPKTENEHFQQVLSCLGVRSGLQIRVCTGKLIYVRYNYYSDCLTLSMASNFVCFWSSAGLLSIIKNSLGILTD